MGVSSITHGGITTITLDSPGRNSVDPATAKELHAAFVAFEEDKEARCAVLVGANSTFSSGFNLRYVSESSKRGTKDLLPDLAPLPDRKEDVPGTLGPMGPTRLSISKPVIAAISEFAVAGGLELALLCDLRVAEEDAVMGVFCRRFGVPLIDGGTVRLPAIVGFGRALDLILTGRPVSAQEALSMGLVNRVVPKGQALAEATALAQQIAAFPQRCMNIDRASAYYAAFDASSKSDALHYEYRNGLPVIADESVAGARRFSEGEGRGGKFGKSKL